MIGPLVKTLTERAKAPGEWRIFAGKARAGPDIGKIENEVIDRIRFILQRSRDRESFAALEKTEDHAAPRRFSIQPNEAETPPGISRRDRDFDGLIMLQFRTTAADQRQRARSAPAGRGALCLTNRARH